MTRRVVTARISRAEWKKDRAWSEKNAGRGDCRRVAIWHPKSETVELFRSTGAFETDGIELPYPADLQAAIVAPAIVAHAVNEEDLEIVLEWV